MASDNTSSEGTVVGTVRRFFDNSRELIQAVGRNGTFRYVNPSWCRALGYASADVPGLTLMDVIHPDSRSHYAALLPRILAGEDVGVVEAAFQPRAGDPLWVEGSIQTWTDDTGEVITLGVFRDVTRRRRTEEALQESEGRFRAIAEWSRDWLWSIDTNGRLTYSNEGCIGLTGYTAEEVVKLHREELSFPEDRPALRTLLDEAIVTKRAVSRLRFRYRHKDGGNRWGESSSQPIVRGGVVVGWHLLTRDITEQVEERREDRQRSLSLLQAAMEATADGIVVVDTDGRVTSANRQYFEMWQVPDDPDTRQDAHALLEWTLKQFRDPKSRRRDLEALANQPDRAASSVIELIDGRVFETHTQPQVLEEKVVGRVFSYRDITERTRAEEALGESEARYRTLAEAAQDLIFVLTPDARLEYINSYGADRFGVDLRAVQGRPVEEVFPPEVAASQRRNVSRVCTTGKAVDAELLTPFPSGPAWITTRLVPITDPAGNVTSVLGVGRDVTDRKRLEEVVRVASRMEATATLAGGIAHGFNNLMTLVLGNASLVRWALPKDHAAVDRLKGIEDAALKAGRLAGQMLSYARGGRYLPKVLNLNDTLLGVLELQQKSMSPRTEVERNLEPALRHIYADPAQMEQVAMSLCVNALEAIGESGRVTVTTSNEYVTNEQPGSCRDLKPGPYVLLTVEDTGCGIDEETRARVFEPFFSTKFTGRGLGLAAAYGIVRNHDGAICVDSQPGEGATFRVYLPATDRDVSGVSEGQELTGTETVLIIDDNEDVLETMGRCLLAQGYVVMKARGGQEGVDIARASEDTIHLIVLDMSMPVLGGAEAFPLLRDARPDAKIIICSGFNIDEECQSLLDAGAVGFVGKPFHPDDLARTVRQALDDGT